MSEVKISALLLMILITVTATTAVASAQGTSEVQFNALVNGECFVGYTGLKIFSIDPPDYELWIEFEEQGKGFAQMSGSSEAVSIPTEPLPPYYPALNLLGDEYYSAQSLRAQGFAAVSWMDDNNIKHHLIVSIYPTESNPIPTPNAFSPETDYFLMPMPVQGCTLLGFDATHLSRLGSESISGMALFNVIPFPFSPGTQELHDPVTVLFLIWMDGDTQYQYSILWSQKNREITDLYPFDSFTVKSARIFNSDVRVIS